MSVQEEINKLKPWFHNIHLPTGEQTAPNHFLGDFPAFKWEKIKRVCPENLKGKKVLDIGCNAGFYSIELAKRGANVTAVDLDLHYLKQAEWIAKQFGLEDRITFKQMQVYDLAHTEETFDIVWFMGVFYHLRYPLLALDIVSRVTKEFMIFQTYGLPTVEEMEVPDDVEFHKREILETKTWPKMAFIPNKLAGDLTNWWVPNHQGILSMLKDCGFEVTEMPDTETYLAKKRQRINGNYDWNISEYLSAIGKKWKSYVEDKTAEKW